MYNRDICLRAINTHFLNVRENPWCTQGKGRGGEAAAYQHLDLRWTLTATSSEQVAWNHHRAKQCRLPHRLTESSIGAAEVEGLSLLVCVQNKLNPAAASPPHRVLRIPIQQKCHLIIVHMTVSAQVDMGLVSSLYNQPAISVLKRTRSASFAPEGFCCSYNQKFYNIFSFCVWTRCIWGFFFFLAFLTTVPITLLAPAWAWRVLLL